MTPSEASQDTGNYSPELERLLAKASHINSYYEKDFDVSFSSMLLAFLVSDDIVSQWFKEYVKKVGIDVEKILGERGLDKRIMDDIADAEPSERPTSLRMTTSARKFLQIADQLRQGPAEPDKILQVWHIMAAFIYSPWVHDGDLVRWGFDRKSWSTDFLILMCSLRRKEMGFWEAQHRRAFGEEPCLPESYRAEG